LNRFDFLPEPNDGDTDDGDTFDERGDRVGYGRSPSEEGESEEVLTEMNRAVEEEVEYERGGRVFGIDWGS
jgi:hypothetical protein